MFGGKAFAQVANSGSQLSIPDGPMRLTRRLERGLRGGASIVVVRDWSVSFRRQGRGIAIVGSQLSASVDAPEKLAPIAKIEETRSTAGMWPILLAGDGRIVAAGKHTEDVDVAAAVREAEAMFARRKSSENVTAERAFYLAQLQQASHALIDQLPADLFFPTGGRWETVQPVELPNGLVGEFELVYTSQRAPGSSWLAFASRRVVTRVGGDQRRSLDEWRLEPI